MEFKTVRVIDSSDTNVKKLVFEKEDAVAEAVLYKYPTYQERTVICCSTQSGCPVGCRFCGAGDNFVRNLTAPEIVEQVDHAIGLTEVDSTTIERLQVMFMSMGEPMLNYVNLEAAIRILHMRYPQAKLLISTSAPRVPGRFNLLNHLSKDVETVGLQFSVHESTNEARDKLIPFKDKFTLEEIANAGTLWHAACGRKPFFNYCVHEKNNTSEDVARLRKLFDHAIWECTISVICEREESVAAANKRQEQLASDFSSQMLEQGYSVRVFNPAGQDDIGGGCGQLWFVQEWMQNNSDKAHKSIGSGLPKVHTPREKI